RSRAASTSPAANSSRPSTASNNGSIKGVAFRSPAALPVECTPCVVALEAGFRLAEQGTAGGSFPSSGSLPSVSRASELHTAGQCTVDHQVGSGYEARRRTTQEHNGISDLPGFRHPAGGVEPERGGEQL